MLLVLADVTGKAIRIWKRTGGLSSGSPDEVQPRCPIWCDMACRDRDRGETEPALPKPGHYVIRTEAGILEEYDSLGSLLDGGWAID